VTSLDLNVWGPPYLNRQAKPCPPGKCRRDIDGWPANRATELELKSSTCRFCGWSSWSVSIRLRLQYGPAVQFFEDFVKRGRFSEADPAGTAWSTTEAIRSVKLTRIPDVCIYDAPVHRLARLPPLPPGAELDDIDLDDDNYDGHTMIDPQFPHLPRTESSEFGGHTIVGPPLVHLPYCPSVNPVEQLEYIDTDPE
jgi:hypothetical protein